MSEDEKDALIGRLFREKSRLTEDVRFIRARAGEIGRELATLGASLKNEPERVLFVGQSFDPNIISPRTPIVSLAGASENALRALTESLREKLGRLREIERELPGS